MGFVLMRRILDDIKAAGVSREEAIAALEAAAAFVPLLGLERLPSQVIGE